MPALPPPSLSPQCQGFSVAGTPPFPRWRCVMTKPFNLTVIDKNISDLKPREGNPRKHPKKQLRQIARSIEQFGFVNPVLVDGSDGIIAGHGRVEAAKLLGMRVVPTVRVDHLSKAEIRADMIEDNRVAENAGWDLGLLGQELKEISESLSIDLTITGFETAEIDGLFGDVGDSDKTDEIPTVDKTAPPVSRPGD